MDISQEKFKRCLASFQDYSRSAESMKDQDVKNPISEDQRLTRSGLRSLTLGEEVLEVTESQQDAVKVANGKCTEETASPKPCPHNIAPDEQYRAKLETSNLTSSSIKWVCMDYPNTRYQDAIESKDCEGFYDSKNLARLRTCFLEGEKAIKGL